MKLRSAHQMFREGSSAGIFWGKLNDNPTWNLVGEETALRRLYVDRNLPMWCLTTDFKNSLLTLETMPNLRKSNCLFDIPAFHTHCYPRGCCHLNASVSLAEPVTLLQRILTTTPRSNKPNFPTEITSHCFSILLSDFRKYCKY